MGEEEENAVIIDNGSLFIKAGIAGENSPQSVFPSIVGRPKHQSAMAIKQKDAYIGDEAQAKRGILTLKYPIERGIINNWDDMEKIWNHIFYIELRANPDDQPVLLTEAALNPKENREKMAQIMFEKFTTPSLYIANQAALSIYLSNETTGVVVESGDGVTSVVPVFNGSVIQDGVQRLEYAGSDLTKYLMKIVDIEKYGADNLSEQIFREIKEKVCYVAEDCDSEEVKEQSYELPDGRTVTLGSERFKCTEALFKPSLLGLDCKGIHEAVYESVLKSADDDEEDTRKSLYKNLVLSGGNTMFSGIGTRFEKEFKALAPSAEIKVTANATGKESVWIGASIFASLSNFPNVVVTKEEFDESGPSIVERCN